MRIDLSIPSINAIPFQAVGIIGISGRMGQRIVHELQKSAQCTWIGGYDQRIPEMGMLCQNMDAVFDQASWVLDFSHASLFPSMIQSALKNPRPMIVGTSGLDDAMMASLHKLSEKIPVIFAPNTSLGAVIQRWVAKKLSGFLPETYDIDIIETHHRHKKDTPSGTSLALGKAVQQGKKEKGLIWDLGETTSPRESNRIEIHALRCGNMPGAHEILWTSADERLVFSHTAFSGEVWAHGAIALLRWLTRTTNPGFYTVEDVLGLNDKL